VGSFAFGGISLGFVLLLGVVATSSDGWIPFLDGANLCSHEAGPLIFGLLGWETLGILGGTLRQLLVPLLVGAAFWRTRQTPAFGVAPV
jgi:hypothetical protein